MKPEIRATPKFLMTREEAAFALGIKTTKFDELRTRLEIPHRTTLDEGAVREDRRGRRSVLFNVRDIRRVADALPEVGSRRNFENRLREMRGAAA